MRQYPSIWQNWRKGQQAFALRLFKPSGNARSAKLRVQTSGQDIAGRQDMASGMASDMASGMVHFADAGTGTRTEMRPAIRNRSIKPRALTLVQHCELSVIVPVYNEGAGIEQTLKALHEFAQTHPTYRFIVVDDGSTDGSSEILRDRLVRCPIPAIQLVSYRQNRGKGFAVRQGIQHAESDYVCFLDSDLAYSLDHLEVLLAKLQTCDVVIGCRSLGLSQQQRIKFFRRLSGKVFNLLSRWILNLEFRDMQAGLKGFDRLAAEAIFARQTLTGFSFDVELIYLAEKYGYRIGEIPAQVSTHHASKQSKVNLIKDSLRMLGDLLKIRYHDWLGGYD